jgi:hypothetical protein
MSTTGESASPDDDMTRKCQIWSGIISLMTHDDIHQTGKPDKGLEAPHVGDQVWSGVARLGRMIISSRLVNLTKTCRLHMLVTRSGQEQPG